MFLIAIERNELVPNELVSDGPDVRWHPESLVDAYAGMSAPATERWVWWKVPAPPARNTRFADLIEEEPTGVDWHSPDETDYLLSLMTPVNRAKVASAKMSGKRTVGSVYRRMRSDTKGAKLQRAEVRFDDLAGCLRTPAGGSSRQSILECTRVRERNRELVKRKRDEGSARDRPSSVRGLRLRFQ